MLKKLCCSEVCRQKRTQYSLGQGGVSLCDTNFHCEGRMIIIPQVCHCRQAFLTNCVTGSTSSEASRSSTLAMWPSSASRTAALSGRSGSPERDGMLTRDIWHGLIAPCAQTSIVRFHYTRTQVAVMHVLQLPRRTRSPSAAALPNGWWTLHANSVDQDLSGLPSHYTAVLCKVTTSEKDVQRIGALGRWRRIAIPRGCEREKGAHLPNGRPPNTFTPRPCEM